MKYIYFVSYTFKELSNKKGYGSVEIHLKKKLDNMPDIRALEKELQESKDVKELLFNNIILLRKEKNKGVVK